MFITKKRLFAPGSYRNAFKTKLRAFNFKRFDKDHPIGFDKVTVGEFALTSLPLRS